MAARHYRGSCQCGAVTFEVDLDLDSTIVCNCSRCRRLGSVLAFAPRENFTLVSGADNLSEYLFNTRQIRHLFCKTCGIEGFACGTSPGGGEMAAVNARCLEAVDVMSLHPQFFDGASK